MREFKLSDTFLEEFKGKQPKFGALGLVTYTRTYSRVKEDGSQEEFWETVRRVVEGVYSIQKEHCKYLGVEWNNEKAQSSAKEMYRRIWDFKFLPPGRGLWVMGTSALDRAPASAFNCAFVSTQDLKVDLAEPFAWAMEMLMLGVGVGFDCKGASTIKIVEPKTSTMVFQVPDTREGWVDALRAVISPYCGKGALPESFDFSKVRQAGEPIKGFGGVSSGPAPLSDLLGKVQEILQRLVGQQISVTAINDIMNLIGRCVVSGNVRRSAELSLGDSLSEEFLNLKNPEINQDKLMEYRWASNNSVYAHVGMDYTRVASLTAKNGEPGYVWLDNCRKYSRLKDGVDNKDYRVTGVNPCAEITLDSYELCVTGDTRIHTRDYGHTPISQLIGKEVEVWNGDEWSTVVPFQTSNNSEILRVTFSDGSYLDCTKYHRFSTRAKTRRHFVITKAEDLKKGDILPKFALGRTSGIEEKQAYNYGLFTGDGYMDLDYPMISMTSSHLQKCVTDFDVSFCKPHFQEGGNVEMQRARFKNLNHNLCKFLRDYDFGLPNTLFNWDSTSILSFIAGLIDTDGSIMNPGSKSESYRIYGSESKLRDLQQLARRAGINNTGLSIFAPKGSITNKGVRNYDLWMLNIHSVDCAKIPTKFRIATKFGNGTRVNNRYPSSVISSLRNQTVESVVYLNKQPTYCFYEPKKGMGVFGNVLTHQCNIVETFPSNHDSLEDYLKTLKYAYLYAKTVTLLKTHSARTNSVIQRNRRIGCSMSGIVQAINKFGRREFFNMCDEGYSHLKQLDREYSDWLCIPRSIKISTVKPSGSVSLLSGNTPGIHFPHSEYYIRRIRFQESSPMLSTFRKNGYKVEKDAYSPNTVVVEFPVKEEYYSRGKADVTIWEQVDLAANMQYYWADNSVSITVTVKPEESKDIKHVLESYETRLKTVSFLPLEDHKYVQAPYETITKEQYEAMMSSITPVTSFNGNTAHEITEVFCSNDVCEIKTK